MKESKNDILLLELNKINNLPRLNEEELYQYSKMISSDINLNVLKRGITYTCIILSQNEEIKVGMDNENKLKVINKLLNNHLFISSTVRSLRKCEVNPKENKKELLIFIHTTIETLKVIKEYQKLKSKKPKEEKKQPKKDEPVKNVATTKVSKIVKKQTEI